jgi:hypothetical protein
MTVAATGATQASTGGLPRKRRRVRPDFVVRAAIVTVVMLATLLVFLSPLAYGFLISVKSEEQISQLNAPLLPSDPATFEHQGKTRSVYLRPDAGRLEPGARSRQEGPSVQ